MPDYENRVHFIINVLFIGLIVGIVLVLGRFVVPSTLPFLIGFGIAYVLKPVTAFLTRKTPFRRKAISIAVISLFYAALSSIVLTILAIAFGQIGKLLTRLPDLYAQGIEPVFAGINHFIFGLFEDVNPQTAGQLGDFFEILLGTFKNAVGELSAAAAGWITNALTGLPMFLTTLLFTIISSILISTNYSAVSSFLLRQLSPRYRHMLLDTKDFMIGSLFKMIKAYVIILAVTMTELSIGLWILRVDLYLAIGVIVALLDILPLIGSGGILIPWALIELGRGNLQLGIGLLILFAVVAVVRNIIEPKIVGQQIGLHPVVTIAAMYFGLRLFGFLGLVLAPMTAILIKYLNDSGRVQIYKS